MVNKEFHINDLMKVAEHLVSFLDGRKKIMLTGDLGAGKTTLIKALCKQLGVTVPVTSPTFAIVNEYPIANRNVSFVYHLDLYRLNSIEEAIHIGIEEYLYNDCYCLIEWPEIIEPLWPEHSVKIQLEIIEEYSRKISYF